MTNRLENEAQESFMQAFKEMDNVTNSLQSMKQPDVDAIIPLTEKGMQAYKICKSRIQLVEKYLASFEEEKD